MYYGEGAGTRRKLIKAKVEQRSKEETYKKAFEEALANQDMAGHAVKARRQRARKDVLNVTTGRSEKVAAAGLIAAVGIIKVTGLDKKAVSYGKSFASDMLGKMGRRTVEDLLGGR